MLLHSLVKGLHGSIVVALKITKVDVDVYFAVFWPRVDGQMTFAQANNGRVARRREVMINFAKLLQIA